MMGGLLVFKGKDLLDTYLLRGEIAKCVSYLEFAKECALAYQADIELKVIADNNGCKMMFLSDEPALKTHKLFLNPQRYKHIDLLKLNGKKDFGILFSGNGWVFPLGVIEIIPRKGKICRVEIDPTLNSK